MHYRSRSSLVVGGGKPSGGRPKADCRWQIALGALDRLGRGDPRHAAGREPGNGSL